MILTGPTIAEAVASGDIILSPYNQHDINPNSYNYHLGPTIIDENGKTMEIAEDGMIFEKGKMYLGSTAEVIGSQRYAMSLIGRSSMGRLGLFLQVSANLGHRGSAHRWTLELYFARSLKLYPGMCVGQVSFWINQGSGQEYIGKYAKENKPFPSLLRMPK